MIMIKYSRLTVRLMPVLALFTIFCFSCNSDGTKNRKEGNASSVTVQAEDYIGSEGGNPVKIEENGNGMVKSDTGGWLEYQIKIPVAGRYSVSLFGYKTDSSDVACWIEDYVGNKDGRTYNITGNMHLQNGSGNNMLPEEKIFGSPLDSGIHKIRLHYGNGQIKLDRINFDLIRPHKASPLVMTQNVTGKEWKQVWSDEFDGTGIPDTTKWTFDIGNWGWGNNELQYYTVNRTENARQEEGNLVIEARKEASGWTSARLTTRGKVTFLHGKIEFRAKVPAGLGSWAAGWLLGESYRDELSWPYCGEIDVLENVGFEIDDQTGNGKTHASIHCGAYYFKLGNQPTAITDVGDMTNSFHTYTMEWLEKSITIFVDGKKYFEYNDASNELTWPFDKPQNLIINLAMGGGWGGAKGVDPEMTSQKFIIDYIRVFELR